MHNNRTFVSDDAKRAIIDALYGDRVVSERDMRVHYARGMIFLMCVGEA